MSAGHRFVVVDSALTVEDLKLTVASDVTVVTIRTRYRLEGRGFDRGVVLTKTDKQARIDLRACLNDPTDEGAILFLGGHGSGR